MRHPVKKRNNCVIFQHDEYKQEKKMKRNLFPSVLDVCVFTYPVSLCKTSPSSYFNYSVQ